MATTTSTSTIIAIINPKICLFFSSFRSCSFFFWFVSPSSTIFFTFVGSIASSFNICARIRSSFSIPTTNCSSSTSNVSLSSSSSTGCASINVPSRRCDCSPESGVTASTSILGDAWLGLLRRSPPLSLLVMDSKSCRVGDGGWIKS